MLSLAKIITKEAFKTRDRKSKNYRTSSQWKAPIFLREKKIRFRNDRKETRKKNLSLINQPFVSPKTFASSSVLLYFNLLEIHNKN